ncbi:MAG: glutathione peroxidase [Chryseolinea sp.]
MSLGAIFSSRISNDPDSPLPPSIYDFKVPGLDGKVIDFAAYRGKRLLIVNTASKCGFTPQYEDLEKIHSAYGGKVAVLGFPANNFLWQEPASNDQIAEFCVKNFGVSFQMFQKISVKGRDKHDLYRWLEEKSGKSPSWNFGKYVVSAEGNKVRFFSSGISPLDSVVRDALENL